MSKQEQAYSILRQFSEEELERFIAYFSIIYPVPDEAEELKERRESFTRLEKMCRHIPDLDAEKELAEYREEKYGI
ncbi:MAG: hypothetical protein IJ642_12995 [Oscillospiraceae bacterium]|nr:hypothetical protein [Oscillospiraceae bacterium]